MAKKLMTRKSMLLDIPEDVEFVQEGTTEVWVRRGDGFIATLDYRVERQALPRGSSPLMAFGGRTIDGEYFTADEVEVYLQYSRLDRNDVCVFEQGKAS